MFEAAVLDVATADSELTSFLSTYASEEGTAPSIFFNSAPPKTEFDYLVFTITDTGNEADSVIDLFVVTFDYFGYSKSSSNAVDAMKRIVELFDRTHLSDSYYDTIRFFKTGIDYVESGDPLAQHYNTRFKTRAGRSGWMSTL